MSTDIVIWLSGPQFWELEPHLPVDIKVGYDLATPVTPYSLILDDKDYERVLAIAQMHCSRTLIEHITNAKQRS